MGLADTPGKRQLLNDLGAWLVGTIGGLIILFGVIIRYAPTVLPRYFPSFLATEFVAEAIAVSALMLVLGLLALSTRYRLTQLGKSLQRSANRFYRKNSSAQKKSGLPLVPRRTWIMWGGLAAFFVCALPFVLQVYLPRQLRIDTQPPTVIISSPPATPRNPPPPPNASSPASPQGQGVTLSADDIRMLMDFWQSVADQMNDILILTNDSNALLQNWPQRIKDGGTQAMSNGLLKQRDTINQRISSLQSLYAAYQNYPNVRATLDELGGKGFSRLYNALTSFINEVQNLGTPPPKTFESTLRPYADELKGALDTMAEWATSTRDFALHQRSQLSQIDLR